MAEFQRESKTFSQVLSFTRGTTGTYFDSAGVLQTAAVDEPRFTHDPDTLESLGLLIEEQRTRLNTIAAAPTDPENVTVSAVAHTISFFGTGTVDLTGVATETLAGTGADDRVTLTFTPSAGTLTITPSGAVQNLQLEVGSFETSVILGEGSQVTRSADTCSRTLGSEFNASEGTIYFKYYDNDDSGIKAVFDLSDGSASNRFVVAPNNTFGDLVIRAENNTVYSSGLQRSIAGVNKVALSFKSGEVISVFNGGSAATGALSLIPTVTALYIGNGGTGGFSLNDIVSEARFIPRALSATELQELTS